MFELLDIKITDVRCVKGDSAFLLDDGKTSVLYDTGFGFTGFGVAENIKKVLGERKLDYIFLTHSHYDHALGSAYILRHYPEAKVVAFEYAAEVFRRDGAKRVMRELDSAFAKKCGAPDYEFLGDELRVDICVRDGDIIKAGEMEFEVLSLPGHTRCSVGYYLSEKKLFLSTETLGVYNGKDTIVPSYLVSYSDSIASIERVKKLDIDYLLAPHYGILNEEQTSYFLGNMKSANEETAQFILSLLREGRTHEEIFELFVKKYRKDYMKEIYPIDAMKLNTSIMIKLIEKELLPDND